MVVFKQISDYKKDGTKYTQKDHIGYCCYIAMRDGAVYGEELDHGLFGKIEGMDAIGDIPDMIHAAFYVGERFSEGKNVYRCAISLTEKEATELGYVQREKWTEMLSRNLFDIAERYNIKFSDLEFVGSVHFEPKHPHVQFDFWDKNQTIQQKILSPQRFEKRMEAIRANLAKDIYADKLPDILKEKEVAEKDTVSGFAGFLKGIAESDIDAGKEELRAISVELCDGKMLNIKDISDQYVDTVFYTLQEVRKSIKENYPKGAIKYAYLPPQCKESVDKLAEILFTHPDYRQQLDKMLSAVRKYSEALGNGSSTIQSVQKKTLREMRVKMGNQILNFIKTHPENSLDARLPQKLPSSTNIFDTHILKLCNEDGEFQVDDIRDTQVYARVRHLTETGDIKKDGGVYSVTPQFKADVTQCLDDFKQHKIGGWDKLIVELGHFTMEELRAHPENEKGRLVKRLPVLLASKLITEEGGVFHVAKEYADRYRQRMEQFRQSRYEQWMEENIHSPVKIGVLDNRFITLAYKNSLTMEELEQQPDYKPLSSRIRRLVAERYMEQDGVAYILTPEFRKEVTTKIEEFKQHFSGTDRVLIEMGRFTLDEVKKHPRNERKNQTDLCGRLEKKLPLLVASGLIIQLDGQYQISDEYREAYYNGQALYRQQNFEKNQKEGHTKAETQVALMDSEFLMFAREGCFTQGNIEQHPEANRLDWRLRQHTQSGLILQTGGEYELTERFIRKVEFVQKKFLKGFSVQYRDRDFLKMAQNGIIPQSAIKAQKNAAYLRWRTYGLQFKELLQREGDGYRVTEELRNAVDAAVQEYLKAFTPRIFDSVFLELEEPLKLEAVESHPLGPLLLERLEGLQYHGFVTEAEGGTFLLTDELKKSLDKCVIGFSFHPGDMAIVRMLDDNRFVSREAIEQDFRSEFLTTRLEEFVRMGAAAPAEKQAAETPEEQSAEETVKPAKSETATGYRLTQEAIDSIKATLPEFRLHLSDRLFLELGPQFSEDDVEEHPEGVLLSNRLRALVANKYLKVTEVNGMSMYSPSAELEKGISEGSALYREMEPMPFDIELVRMSKDGCIPDEIIAKLKKAVQIERRLLDLSCKGYVIHENGAYRLSDDFIKGVQSEYAEFSERFAVAPCDHYFVTLADKEMTFQSDSVAENEFYQRRLRSLQLLQYITAEEDGLHISESLSEALALAEENFSINHFDAEFVRIVNAAGAVDVAGVLSIDENYFTKRMYSLIELELLRREGDMLYATPELRSTALQKLQEFLMTPHVSCYDRALWNVNGTTKLTKEDLAEHPDGSFLKGRLRSLMQLGFVKHEDGVYTLSSQLAQAVATADREFQIKGTDNRFLQVNGNSVLSEKEVNEHPELSMRLRELCWKGLILKEESEYRLSDRLIQGIGQELEEFAQNKIGTWDRPLLDLSRLNNGFTLEDIKNSFPQEYEKHIQRLERLYIHNLFQKKEERYFHTPKLEAGVIRAEKREQGIRRQVAVSLLMDGYRLLSKLANQQSSHRMEHNQSSDLSQEAKKDRIAALSSAGADGEDYDR